MMPFNESFGLCECNGRNFVFVGWYDFIRRAVDAAVIAPTLASERKGSLLW